MCFSSNTFEKLKILIFQKTQMAKIISGCRKMKRLVAVEEKIKRVVEK